MTDDFRTENRAAWRLAIQQALGAGGDPWGACTWTRTEAIAAVLHLVSRLNLSYALAPQSGGYEFTGVDDTDPAGDGEIVLLSRGEHRHRMQVRQLDYVPHPLDSADAIFRLELHRRAPDDDFGSVRLDGVSQYRHGTDRDANSETRWNGGVFVFTAKLGLFNDVDPPASTWEHQDASGLARALATLVNPQVVKARGGNGGNVGALQALAASPATADLDPSWVEMWLAWLPSTLSPSIVRATAAHYAALDRMPSFPEFREKAERQRDGIALDVPYVTRPEENALLLLAEHSRRYPELDDSDRRDAFLCAAAALYVRESIGVGLREPEYMVDEFGRRSAMFARAAATEWLVDAENGKAPWDAILGRPSSTRRGD